MRWTRSEPKECSSTASRLCSPDSTMSRCYGPNCGVCSDGSKTEILPPLSRASTGKTSLAAHFVDAACARGEKCVFFSFEESEDQLVRNMMSIGINLGRWVK